MPDVDVIVVGAGPAGATAALTLARAGRSVVLLERGPFPGSKNMYGGVVYPRVLDALIPRWWEEAPIQRWVTRRSTMVLTDRQALTVDYRTEAWGEAPYNGATAYRPDFDAWLAGRAEAARIVGGGAGLDGPARFEQLAALGAALAASVGAARVITDRGWVGHDRQIGTTGVVVDPRLYLAFGISGAVQHTSGLGQPEHVVSVNTDPHCPMMQLADLAIVADANAVLDALEARLGG